MKKEISILVIMALLPVLSSISYAAVLDLDEDNMIDGTYIIQDNTTYKIVYRTETYFNGDILKRLVVENSDKIEELQGIVNDMSSDIHSKIQYVLELGNKRNQLTPKAAKLEGVLEIIESQLNSSSEKMDALKERQDELKNMISSNILVSESNYKTAIVVFIVLLVVVALFKGTDLFGSIRKSTKGKNQKGELKIVAQEIRGSPDEIKTGRIKSDDSEPDVKSGDNKTDGVK